MAAEIFALTCALFFVICLVVVLVNKYRRTKDVLSTSRIAYVRAEARSELATQSAERLTNVAEQAVDHADNMAGVASEAVQQVGEALEVAKAIQQVDAKMDTLIGMVSAEQPEDPKHGKHERAYLRAVEEDERFIA